jgi:hypothetical protein
MQNGVAWRLLIIKYELGSGNDSHSGAVKMTKENQVRIHFHLNAPMKTGLIARLFLSRSSRSAVVIEKLDFN